ncbi:hypothetical protein LUZ60_009954 [Juncus effusus]|nr:hypothetical protein LUZ60_009954 [Juncus effusus]
MEQFDMKASMTFSNDLTAVKEEQKEEVESEAVLGQNQGANSSFGLKRPEKGTMSDVAFGRERHRWAEHNRRRKIREMISTLQGYLPRSPQKLDQATVLEETVRFIKSLNRTLETLQNRKLDRLRRSVVHHAPSSSKSQGLIKVDLNAPPTTESTDVNSWESPYVTYSVQGEDAHIRVCAKRTLGLLASIVYMLQNRGIHILTVHITSHDYLAVFIFHARARASEDPSSKVVPNADVIYKRAVRDLSMKLSSLF